LKIKNRTLVLITTYVSAGILVLAGFIYVNYQQTQQYKRYVNNHYQHAFSEMVTCMGELDTALQKCTYARSTPMIVTSCTEIFGKAMAAQMMLGELPFSDYQLEKTSGFIR